MKVQFCCLPVLLEGFPEESGWDSQKQAAGLNGPFLVSGLEGGSCILKLLVQAYISARCEFVQALKKPRLFHFQLFFKIQITFV